ncbi:glucose PTS transporter transcription antiterminator GlcT [Brevibacillus ginsengisoli]|uniref:glucose PTS transporter transcription antiterminator GlcT n=1 Tax=Brevibacillus ginsengisoli TaxID=363854 RepID=UPI003CE944D8
MEKNRCYKIKKIISNNAVLAFDEREQEVILLGKGIGFSRTKNDIIPHSEAIEKIFILSSASNREAILRLLTETDDEVLSAINEYIRHVEQTLQKNLPDRFILSFIDHLSFAIKRLQQGILIHNPFAHEVKSLYPAEFSIAQSVVPLMKIRLNIDIPEDELCFITLHLRSAQTNQSITTMNRYSQLIATLIELIEEELSTQIDKSSTDYARLVTHLRFAIDRAEKQQGLGENHPLSALLQKEYPLCYNLSWKLVKIMQNELRMNIPEAEVSYLTLHIQRLRHHSK